MRLKKNQILVNLTFLILFLIGLNISGGFGLSWDSMQRSSGIRTAGYILTKIGITNPLQNDYKIYPRDHNDAYGVIFDLTSISFEKLFNLKGKKEIYTMRHRLNFTIYFLGCLFYFFLSKRIFGLKVALVSIFLYAFHPRLLAHGFFNPKDSILQAFVIISLYPIYLAIEQNKSKWFILSGIMMGICTSTRIMMLYLPFLFFLAIFSINIKNMFNKNLNIKLLKNCGLTLSFFIISLFFSWPILWEDPVTSFIWAFNIMKNFPWGGDVLFMGEIISSNNLPWFYIPVWYFITTPLIFLLLFIIGMIISLSTLINNSQKKYRMLYFSISGIFIPLISVIVLKSNLYDGWRHFYFIYPFIALVATYGYDYLSGYIKKNKFPRSKFFVSFIFIISIISPSLVSIIKMHPHQNTYFNFLAGSDPLLKYEGDYWGVSYKQGIEKLLALKNGDILLAVGNFPGKNNLQMIDETERKRIKIVDLENADYFMTNFRSDLSNYIKSNNSLYPFNNELFSIKYGEMKILGVYEIN